MAFELQPTLKGEWVELRPLRSEDFEILFAAASDPLIWELHPESDRWTEPVFRRYFDGGINSGGAFLVLDPATGEVIGSTRYAGYSDAANDIEIGWTFLVRSRWGGRWNGEMKSLMLNHAFKFVDAVIFRVGPTNFRSRRAVEKLGAVLQPTKSDAKPTDNVEYRLSRLRWADSATSKNPACRRAESVSRLP